MVFLKVCHLATNSSDKSCQKHSQENSLFKDYQKLKKLMVPSISLVLSKLFFSFSHRLSDRNRLRLKFCYSKETRCRPKLDLAFSIWWLVNSPQNQYLTKVNGTHWFAHTIRSDDNALKKTHKEFKGSRREAVDAKDKIKWENYVKWVDE